MNNISMTLEEETRALTVAALCEPDINVAMDYFAEARRLQPSGRLPSEYPLWRFKHDKRAYRQELERFIAHRLLVEKRMGRKTDLWSVARSMNTGLSTVQEVKDAIAA